MPTMQTASRTARRSALATASVIRRVMGQAIHQLIDHPFEIDRMDASADVLWPRNPEESDPPRWRFDALAGLGEPARPAVSHDAPCVCQVSNSRLVSQGR